MNSTPKFFLGLTCGLLISFFVFNSNSVLNAKGTATETSTDNPAVDGSWETVETMNPKILSYKNEIVPKLPGNASTGGFIKRSVLNDITGSFDGTYIKYQFYHDGDGKIGIFFQKESQSAKGIRTGSSAFCPTMCEFPE